MTETITTAALNADNLNIESTLDGITIEPQYVTFLRNNGYNIETVNAVKYAHSDKSDTAHLMVEVETYLYPKHDDQLDIEQHQVTIRVCDCWAYRSNSPDVSKTGVSPVEYDQCKHLNHFDKAAKASSDENQTEIFDLQSG